MLEVLIIISKVLMIVLGTIGSFLIGLFIVALCAAALSDSGKPTRKVSCMAITLGGFFALIVFPWLVKLFF